MEDRIRIGDWVQVKIGKVKIFQVKEKYSYDFYIGSTYILREIGSIVDSVHDNPEIEKIKDYKRLKMLRILYG